MTLRYKNLDPSECGPPPVLIILFPPLFYGAIISFGRGPKFTKTSVSIKLRPPYFGNKNLMTPPHHRYTLRPKQAKIVLKSVFSNKINTLSVVILWLPIHFDHQKFYDPPIFLSKLLWPQYKWYSFPPSPHSTRSHPSTFPHTLIQRIVALIENITQIFW